MKDKIILAVESSCDETAVAILRNHQEVLSNVVSSQIKDHQVYGGVIPELASRLHLDNIDVVFNEALKQANMTINDIDLIAIVNTPGLVGALHVGVVFAKTLAQINNIPILPVNHLYGHIYANSLITEFEFPLLALVVSGGHTELIMMRDHLDFKLLGSTKDDAIGECYDKVSRVMDLGYPGGPIIDKLAQEGNDIYDFPRALDDNTYNFSYSGLKSAVINKLNQFNMKNTDFNKADVAKSFQEAATDILVKKSLRAIKEYNIMHFVLAGGVAANSRLREKFEIIFNEEQLDTKLTLPPFWCCTDNAIMIAACASYYNEEAYLSDLSFKVMPNFNRLEIE